MNVLFSVVLLKINLLTYLLTHLLTYLLTYILTLKHSHHLNFYLEFHDPSLLRSGGFTLIKLKLSCCDHFIVSFSCYYNYMKLYSSFFPSVAYLSVADILSLLLSPSLLLDSVSSNSKYSSAFNSLCLFRWP